MHQAKRKDRTKVVNIITKTFEHNPIYLETSVERNKLIYERIGYETYDYWQDDAKGIKFWFMKRQSE